MKRILLAVAAICFGPLSAGAQGATIAPHMVVIDGRIRSSTVTLYNPGVHPIEVTTGMIYGTAVTDSAGDFVVAYGADSSDHSAVPWLQVFPRRFTVPPLARQTIRILARPPQALAQGEYWARLSVATRDGAVAIRDSVAPGIHVGLTLEVRTILPVYYRNGVMTTGLTLAPPTYAREGDSLAIRLPMQRTGVAAYVGSLQVTLLDAENHSVADATFAVAVFHDARPRLALSVRGLPSGSYRVRVSGTTERIGAEAGTLVTAPPTHAEFSVVL